MLGGFGGRGRIALASVLLGGVVAGVGSVAPALAATTIGHLPGANTLEMCVDTGGFLQAPGAGQADYTAPFDGVLTSWSTMAGAGANQMVKLKVLHLATGSVYNVVAESEFKPLDASMLNPFPIRIPVHQGDVVGLRTGASGGSVWCL